MATTWDSISGGLTETIDYKAAPSNVEIYPDNSNVTILGQVWLPRIYGKNLTAFEIASSGKISITVNDIHSMDILSSNVNGIFTNRFAAKSNYSMEFYTQNNETRLFMDGSNKNVSLSANQTVAVSACNNVLDLSSGSNILLTATDDLVGRATNNVVFTADTGSLALSAADSNVQVFLDDTTRDFAVFAQSNVSLNAGQDVEATASNSVLVSANAGNVEAAASSNASLKLDSNWHATLWGRSNVNVTASNSVVVIATSNMGLSAGQGSLAMNAGASNVSLDLSSATTSATLYALSNVALTASNNGTFFAQSNLFVTASIGNLVGVAGADLKLTSSNNTTVTSLGRYDLFATGDVALNSLSSNFGLFANASNVFVKSVEGSNLSMSASSNVNLAAGKDVGISATGSFGVTSGIDVTMSAIESLQLNANAGLMSLNLDYDTNIATLNSINRVTVSGGNGVSVTSGEEDITLSAQNGAVAVALSNNTIYGISSGDILLTSTSNTTLAANTGSVLLAANASNVSVKLDSATNSLSIYAQSNFAVTASNTASLWSQSNLTVQSATGPLSLSAADSGASLTLDTSKNVVVYSSNNTTIASSNDLSLNSLNNTTLLAQQQLGLTGTNGVSVTSTSASVSLSASTTASVSTTSGAINLSAVGSETVLNMDGTGAQLTAKSNVQVSSTSGSIGLSSASNLLMSADTSNVYINMAVPADTLSMYALSNVSVSTGQTLLMNAASNISIGSAVNTFITASNNGLFSASNNLTLAASNTLYLRGSSLDASGFNSISWAANSNIDFKILSSESPGDPVFTISSNEVRIRGNIVVTGEINTSNIVNTTVVQQTLKVSDRVIKVANDGSGSNEVGPIDGFLTNDQSGLVIDGYPSMSNASLSNAFEKSLLWHFGDSPSSQGVMALGTSNIDKEAFWEMTGGSFRITHKKVDATGSNYTEVSFGFRINEHDELEMVKKYWSDASSSYVYKRVARFGRIIL